MPLFDPNSISVEGITPDIIASINAVIDRLRLMKVDSLPLSGKNRTSNLIRCFVQAQIRRCLTFIEAGHAEFCAGRSLVVTACARANYENVAAFVDYRNLLIPLLRTGNDTEIKKFVDKTAFSTRIPDLLEEHGQELSAKNILTQIDKMTKENPTYRKAYDYMSDSVHPNAFGSVVHFVSIEENESVATINDVGRNPEWALASLLMSGQILTHVEVAVIDIERHLAILTR